MGQRLRSLLHVAVGATVAGALVVATVPPGAAEAAAPAPSPPAPAAPHARTSAAVAPPRALSGLPANGAANLVWRPSPSAHVRHYVVYRSRHRSGPWSKVSTVRGAARAARVGGLTNGRLSYFAVRAQDRSGRLSARSGPAAVVPLDLSGSSATLAPTSRVLPPAAVLSATQLSRGRVRLVVPKGLSVPGPGGHLVVQPNGYLPRGMFAGILASRLSGTRRLLTVGQASLGDVFTQYDLSYDSTSPAAARAAGRSPFAPPPVYRFSLPGSLFTCEHGGSAIKPSELWDVTKYETPFTVEVSDVKADGGGDAVSNDARQPYNLLTVSGVTTVTAHLETSLANWECHLSDHAMAHYRLAHVILPSVFGIPLTLDIEPSLKISADAKGGFTYSQARPWSYSFEKSGSLDWHVTNADLPPRDVTFTPTLGFSASAFAGLHLALMFGGGVGTLNAKAGIYGDFGGALTLETQGYCVDLNAGLQATFGGELYLMDRRWTKEVFELDSPKVQLAHHCFPPPLPPKVSGTLAPAVSGVYYSSGLRLADTRGGSWSLSSGRLPSGLALDPGTGVISGVPAGSAATYAVTVTFTDAQHRPASSAQKLTLSQPSAVVSSLKGNIAHLADGRSWYVDRRGSLHRIPDGGTYQCLVAQGRHPVDVQPSDLTGLKVIETAQCVRAGRGNIIRTSDGDSYLINADWKRQWIPDGATYQCLEANGHAVVDNVPRYYVMDLGQVGNASMTCSLPDVAKGHVIRVSDGSSWYVDRRGDRHWIPDTATFSCLTGYLGRTVMPLTVPRRDLLSYGTEQEHAMCVRAARGDILRTHDGDAYLFNADWTRSWIPDGGSYQCLAANGHPLVDDVPRYYIDDLTDNGQRATLSCYDAKAVDGKVVRAADGSSWYVDKRGGKHWVPNGGTFDCIAAQVGTYAYTVPRAWLTQTRYEDAACVRAGPGNIIRNHDGDAYLVNANWTRSWIPDGGSYSCLSLNGHAVVDNVPRYYIDDLADSGQRATMSCYSAGAVRGKVVRTSDGSSWYVDKRGGRHWIPNGGTFDCIAAQVGTYAYTVPTSWLTQTRYEDAACVRAGPGNIIRTHDGDAYLLNGDWTRSWIPDGGSYECLNVNGHPIVDNVPRYYIDDLTDNGQRATMSCYDANAVRGKVVRSSDGSSWYVDKRGGKHWIPDGGTFDCIAAQVGTWGYTVPRAWLTQPQYENAACVRASPGNIIRNADGDAYLLNGDWSRSWIPDGATWNCLSVRGHALVNNVPRYYIDDLAGAANTGTGAACGLILTHTDGDSHFIDRSGVRHWIPSTAVYGCFSSKYSRYWTSDRNLVNNGWTTGAWATCAMSIAAPSSAASPSPRNLQLNHAVQVDDPGWWRV